MSSRSPQAPGSDARRCEDSARVVPSLAARLLRGYRVLWEWAWGITISLAALSGLLFGGWKMPLTAALMASVVGLTVRLALDAPPRAAGPRPPAPTSARPAFAVGLRVAVGVGVVVAALSTVGGLIVPLGLLAASTAPALLRRLGSRTRATRPRPRKRPRPQRASAAPATVTSVVDVDAATLRSAIETLDDPGLCHAWRASFTCLALASTAAETTELVHLRQAYLDEMERRHPAGLRAWLDSGARAASDPSRHLHARRTPRPE